MFKIEPPYYVYTNPEIKYYPWPCESQPDRTIELIQDDILVKTDTDTFTMLTGIAKLGILIPEADLHLETEKTIRVSFM